MRLFTASFVLVLGACASAPPPAADPTRLADEYVREYMARFPEGAELSGLKVERHDGLTDNSLAGLAEWQKFEDRLAGQLDTLDLADFEGKPEWVTLGFLQEAVASSRQARICHYELWPINQLSGWQALFSQLADVQPVGSEAARADALARWSRLPRYLDNEIANLREGVRLGYTTPKANVKLVVEQLDGLLAAPIEEWPFYSPARRDKDEAFAASWRSLLTGRISPAVRRYRDYLNGEYLPKARAAMAITANPDGEACYQASFRANTTLDRPGAETYRLGRERVERFLNEALAIGSRTLDASDLPSLVERLRTDPANKFASREELLAYARAAVERSKKSVGKLFSRIPEAQMTVEPYAEMLEKTASDSYWPAAEDGSRPATYRITLFRWAETTRSNAEITAFHEGYPGHHLQISLVQEQGSSHPVTRLVGNSGFIEGWARYAEALAEEAGLYSTPHALANRRLWPSRGMVVDPGIHLFGWTREQAVAYMVESGRFGQREAEAGVDRIAVWPAQLTAYDTGAIEFFALREKAERELGPKFDLREFHEVVLGSGAITLPMLRQKVESWIRRSRTETRSALVP